MRKKERKKPEEDQKKKETTKEMKNYKESGNYIGDEGAKMISKSLKINTTLTELNLAGDIQSRRRKVKER